MNICREICKKTKGATYLSTLSGFLPLTPVTRKGTFGVAINEEHFKDLLFEAVPPPATRKKPGALAQSTADLMLMGFPSLLSSRSVTLCACHSKLRPNGFVCPRCSSKICEVPTDCAICDLTVVASPHLARSYRHLFPVKNWIEVNGQVISHRSGTSSFPVLIKDPRVFLVHCQILRPSRQPVMAVTSNSRRTLFFPVLRRQKHRHRESRKRVDMSVRGATTISVSIVMSMYTRLWGSVPVVRTREFQYRLAISALRGGTSF
jgi:hypothetical protein